MFVMWNLVTLLYRQHKFFRTEWQEISQFDDLLTFVIGLVQTSETCTSRLVRNFVSMNVTPLSEVMTKLIDGIRQSDSSRRLTYKYINSEMEVHKVYAEKQVINEVHRLCFTQFRISGHSLACETGRWNRRSRGRLLLEERLCSCGQIQTEKHVIQHCPMTQGIRDKQFHHYQLLIFDAVFK